MKGPMPFLVALLACAPVPPSAGRPTDEMAAALNALERRVCLTMGVRTNAPGDQCEPLVDRATYLEPLRDVFLAAPPIFRAYLCSFDRFYFDYHSAWNASVFVLPDSQSGKEFRSIGIRRGVMENRVHYADWATAWTQHWWTGGAIDHPESDSSLPHVEIESRLPGSSGILFHLMAHEVAHALAYDYGMHNRPTGKPFEPGEFGFLSWVSPQWEDSSGVIHLSVARESALEAVRRLDFNGNLDARLATLQSAQQQGRLFDPGADPVLGWTPAPRGSIATFLDRLDQSSFTTVFSTWHPEDDWTESFVIMMLPAIAQRFDIVSPQGKRVRVLQKAWDQSSAFTPKRRFLATTIDRALADFRDRHAASPTACLTAALADASRP